MSLVPNKNKTTFFLLGRVSFVIVDVPVHFAEEEEEENNLLGGKRDGYGRRCAW